MMNLTPTLHTFLLTACYTIFGLVVFGFAFWIIVQISPFSMRKEIEEDQNISLAILIGSVMLGLAIIIASTIHG
jgi:putative membrane protein